MSAIKDEVTVVSQTRDPNLSPASEQDDGIYDAAVPPRYRGTDYDKQDMTMLGKRQVLRVGMSTGKSLPIWLMSITAQLQVCYNAGLRQCKYDDHDNCSAFADRSRRSWLAGRYYCRMVAVHDSCTPD
jgi:hypothetical protein